MTDEELFATPALQVLVPPPGGLAGVRATLDRRRPRWWLFALPAVAAVAVVALVLARRVGVPNRTAPPATAQVAPLLADPTIASNDRISFYWVASQAQPANGPVRTVPVEALDPVGHAPDVLIP